MTILEQPRLADTEMVAVFKNRALGTAGATVTATSEAGGNLTADKLLTADLDTAWRSGSIAQILQLRPLDPSLYGIVRLRWTLGRPRPINWLSFHRHNIRVPFRARLYDANPATAPALVETEWIDPIVRAEMADFDFFDFRFDRGPDTERLDLWTATKRLDSFTAFGGETYYAVRYVDLEFDVKTPEEWGQVDDYLQFSLPMIGQAFQPRINLLLDWEYSVEDRSEVRRVDSGALLGRQRSVGRSVAFVLGYLDRDEAFERVLTEWAREGGKLGRVFVWPEPDQPRYFYDQAVLGTMAALPKVAMANLDWPAATGFVVEETE